VVLCIGETKSTPPKIHVVYGEVGSESTRAEIWKPAAENPPENQVAEEVPSGSSTEALDAELMGGSVSSLGDAGNQGATPLLMTADGAGTPIFGGEAPVNPRFHFTAPSFPSSDSSSTSSSDSADFAFSGTDADLAELVKGLVQAGAPLCGVEEKSDSLEAIFSKLSSGEVM